jgi:hypothetical protein
VAAVVPAARDAQRRRAISGRLALAGEQAQRAACALVIHLRLPGVLRPVTRAFRLHRHAPTVVTVLDLRPNQRARRTQVVIGRDREA